MKVSFSTVRKVSSIKGLGFTIGKKSCLLADDITISSGRVFIMNTIFHRKLEPQANGEKFVNETATVGGYSCLKLCDSEGDYYTKWIILATADVEGIS